MPLTQQALINDSVAYFSSINQAITANYNQSPIFYAVHIRPIMRVIKAIPYPERSHYMSELVLRIRNKLNSYLIKKPQRQCNRSFVIKSRNFVENHTKHGYKEIHHAHCVWTIHPLLINKFKALITPFDITLINVDERHLYLKREIFSLKDELLNPLKDDVHSIMIEEVHDLESILSYCTKHHDKAIDPHSFLPF